MVAGGGRLLGVHSGSPHVVIDPTGASVGAHRGLARAYVRSSEVRAGSAAARRALAAVHVEAGLGGAAAIVVDAEGEEGMEARAPPPPIVVRAEAAGLPAATLSIPMTTDLAALPLAVATASVSGRA